MILPFIKKALEFAPKEIIFFRGASSPVIVQRVTKRAIKLKTRLLNSQLTQILKYHQQSPKRLENCQRTKLLSEKPITIRFALHFCKDLASEVIWELEFKLLTVSKLLCATLFYNRGCSNKLRYVYLFQL